jgi:protoporphyrinogen oxidase
MRRLMFTRRDLFAGFLGVAVANAACRTKRARATVPGSLVDRVAPVGHLLRGPPPPLATEDTRVLDVLVVGGGAAGLSAAWRLAGAGVDAFQVVELDEAVGGTARGGQNAVSGFPWGAHYLPAPLSASGPVPRLLRELGVLTGVDARGQPELAEDALVQEPEERLFFRGSWYEGLYLRAGASADDLAQLARFQAAMSRFAAATDSKGRKAFDVPMEKGSDDAEWTALDRLSMAEWLAQEGYTSSRLLWLVDYACRDDYGASPREISAWAGIWYFAARQTGEEKNDGYLSWPEGNGRLVRHLAEATGRARVTPNVLIHTVEPVPGSTELYAHGLDAVTKKPLRFRARQVVLAAPRFVAGHVVAAFRKERPAWLDAFRYSPWVVANLTLSERPRSRGFPLSWDNVFYESKSLGYVVATHQRLKADEHGPTVLTWYYPLAGDDVTAERTRLLSTGYEDWEAVVMADLMPTHQGLEPLVERLEVMRWGHAMVRPRPGFVFGGARTQAAASLGALHFAHTDLGGLALFEEANWHGVRAAEAALAGLGRTPESWL